MSTSQEKLEPPKKIDDIEISVKANDPLKTINIHRSLGGFESLVASVISPTQDTQIMRIIHYRRAQDAVIVEIRTGDGINRRGGSQILLTKLPEGDARNSQKQILANRQTNSSQIVKMSEVPLSYLEDATSEQKANADAFNITLNAMGRGEYNQNHQTIELLSTELNMLGVKEELTNTFKGSALGSF